MAQQINKEEENRLALIDMMDAFENRNIHMYTSGAAADPSHNKAMAARMLYAHYLNLNRSSPYFRLNVGCGDDPVGDRVIQSVPSAIRRIMLNHVCGTQRELQERYPCTHNLISLVTLTDVV